QCRPVERRQHASLAGVARLQSRVMCRTTEDRATGVARPQRLRSSTTEEIPTMSDWQKRYQRLLFDRPHPKVLRVTMNRPEKYNATDAIMHRELVDVWRDIDGDDTVNCVIIQGAGGKVFSAGGDFDIIEKNIKDYNALLRTWKEARDIVYNVINCSKPIVS